MTSASAQAANASPETSVSVPPVSAAVIPAAFAAIIARDVILLLRRPSRIAATVLTPALLWAFFASGFASTLASAGDDAGTAYTLALAAGAALLVVTFASIFGSLGLIRDRETGYLQAVLVGPTPRWVVISARVASGASLAWVQASVMLLAAAWLVSDVALSGVFVAAFMLIMTAFGLSGACTAIAWHFRSIEGFHGVMSGVLMPAWLLSGAVFPPDAPSEVMNVIMAFNPLAYAHRAIAGSLGAFDAGVVPLVVTAAFGVSGCLAAIAAARGDAKR